jgi:hypothetical protein
VADTESNLRELRILAQRRGALIRLCKFIFSNKDASIYLVPYAAGRRYFCGSTELPEREITTTLLYTEGAPTDGEPKLSLHQSGQVHVQASGARVGIVQTCPLEMLRGQHLATVCFDQFDGLSLFSGTPKPSGAERDFLFMIGDDVASGRLALFVNGLEPTFACGICTITLTLRRPTLVGPLYVGIQPIEQQKLGEPDRSGVTVIAGWNPTTRTSDRLNYVYLRGD